jgi:hypothetical protein
VGSQTYRYQEDDVNLSIFASGGTLVVAYDYGDYGYSKRLSSCRLQLAMRWRRPYLPIRRTFSAALSGTLTSPIAPRWRSPPKSCLDDAQHG